MIFFAIVLAYMIGIRIGTYGIFKKLGIEPWKAFVPVVSSKEWQKIIDKPSWWSWMLFIPGVNLFYVASQLTEMSTAFGRYSFFEHFAAVIFSIVYIPYLGFSPNEKFIAPGGVKPGQKPIPRSAFREWADAIVFAVVAATLIRIFVAEAYMIPTESMEKTLMVGDFLFVSKFHYGARIPNTPLAMPFVHHTIPVINTKSYVDWIKLPYKTLPGFQDVKRNDMVVFNFPAGDTVIKEFESEQPYYDVIRQIMAEQRTDYSTARDLVWSNFHVVARPVDKRENYIKRCVAKGGDKLEVKDGLLYINDELAYFGENAQNSFEVSPKGGVLPYDLLRKYDITTQTPAIGNGVFDVALTKETAEALAKEPEILSIKRNITAVGDGDPYNRIFPNEPRYYHWNVDQFGPIMVPAKGTTITLNDSIYPQYDRAIRVYEGNTVERKDGKFFINGQETTSYTFKMNYYWLMGDNRHRSQDSRFWGFVPEDHVVGKAWFIWMSYDKNAEFIHKIRWSRLFSSIHNRWAPTEEKYLK